MADIIDNGADAVREPELKQNKTEVEYADRAEQDGALASAIADVLAAEQQARHIVGTAEERAKAVQLDTAVRSRDMREQFARSNADANAAAVRDAIARAEAHNAERMREAAAESERIVKAAKKNTDEIIKSLYKQVGGVE